MRTINLLSSLLLTGQKKKLEHLLFRTTRSEKWQLKHWSVRKQ